MNSSILTEKFISQAVIRCVLGVTVCEIIKSQKAPEYQ